MSAGTGARGLLQAGRLGLLRSRFSQFRQIAFSNRYLLVTNCAISVSLSIAGDSVQQYVQRVRQNAARDASRTMRMGATGFMMGVMCHYWYKYLDRFLHGRTMSVVAKKVLIDQIIFSPIMWVCAFALLSVLEHDSYETFKKRLFSSGMNLYVMEWIVWPPAQWFNFAYLPTKYRVLYDNTISFMFDWYSSYVINDQKEHLKGHPVEPAAVK